MSTQTTRMSNETIFPGEPTDERLAILDAIRYFARDS
jgi:hypothetical protein